MNRTTQVSTEISPSTSMSSFRSLNTIGQLIRSHALRMNTKKPTKGKGGVGGKKDAAQNTFTKLIENFKTGHISGPRGMNKNGKVANPTPLACPPFWTFSKITVHRCHWFLAWITSYIRSAALDRALFTATPTSNWTLIIVISVSVISSNCVALFHWFRKPAPPSQPIRSKL